MGSRFGGIPVDDTPAKSKFGGIPVDDSTPVGTQDKPGFIQATLQKTAENMNPEALLRSIGELGTHESSTGAESEETAEAKHQALLGSIHPALPFVVNFAKDVAAKLHDNDYSGIAASVLPILGAAFGPEAVEGAKGLASDAAEGISNAASKSPTLAAAKTLLPSSKAVASKLPGVADAINTVKATAESGSKAIEAYQKQAAINRTNAAAAAHRAANPVEAPTPVASPDAIPAVQPIAPQYPTGRASTPAGAPPPVVPPRVSLADQAGIQPGAAPVAPAVQPIAPQYATGRSSAPSGPPPPAAASTPAPIVKPTPPARVPLWQRSAVPPAEEVRPTPGIPVPKSLGESTPVDSPQVKAKPTAASLVAKMAAGGKVSLDDLTNMEGTKGPRYDDLEHDYTSDLQAAIDALAKKSKDKRNK